MLQKAGTKYHRLRIYTLLTFLGFQTAAFVEAPARAEEPLFGFTSTTDLLPEGKSEVAQWLTWRDHKAHGSFDLLEGRTEVEYGVSDDFQLAAYGIYDWAEAQRDLPNHTTAAPAPFTDDAVDPNGRFERARFQAVAVEGIYRLLSPYTDPVGLALYVLPTIGDDERHLQTKLIVQKNFLDDRLVSSFNLSLEQAIDQVSGTGGTQSHWVHGTELTASTGVAFRFIENWSAGAEFLNERTYDRLIFWTAKYRDGDAYYFGPVLHYGGEHTFLTLTALEQLPFAKDYANPSPGLVLGGRSYAANAEKYRVRLKFGYYF